MVCFVPIAVLIERRMPDGSDALLLAPDLPTALADAVQAEASGAWVAHRLVMGRDSVLEGDALRQALRDAGLAGF